MGFDPGLQTAAGISLNFRRQKGVADWKGGNWPGPPGECDRGVCENSLITVPARMMNLWSQFDRTHRNPVWFVGERDSE